jgi:signal transduction histidine kinase
MNAPNAGLNEQFANAYLYLVRQSSPVECALIDQDHRIRFLTSGFASLFSKTTNQLVGLKIEELINGGFVDAEVTDNHDARILELQNGKSFNCRTIPIADTQPLSGYKIVILCKDTIIPSEIEEQLTHYERLASLGSITASIIHQLATPLSLISNSAEILLDTYKLEGEVHSRISAIHDESLRLINQSRKLLDFVRKAEIELKAQDAIKLVTDVLDILQLCNLQEVKFQMQVENNLPQIHGNAELLQQVFFNLLNNSIEALEKGGEIKIKISQSISYLTNNARAVEFAIEDNGSGISSENIKRVFDPFVSTKPSGKGTGLGLPIARRIVEAHGGTLQLDSVQGKGTKVIVRLPVWNNSSKRKTKASNKKKKPR